jgi:hypothetical protein
VNHLVLSGTDCVVPSGTRSSCYRGPESQLTAWRSTVFRPRNFTNLESFGFLLTDRHGWRPVDNRLTAQSRASDRRRVVTLRIAGVGLPKWVDWQPKMSDRLLKSWTAVPLIVDWRNGESPSQENFATPPDAVHAQQSVCNIDRDLDAEATPGFVLDSICPPSRFIRRRRSNPCGKPAISCKERDGRRAPHPQCRQSGDPRIVRRKRLGSAIALQRLTA